jgi:hypothetical protein
VEVFWMHDVIPWLMYHPLGCPGSACVASNVRCIGEAQGGYSQGIAFGEVQSVCRTTYETQWM